MLSQKLIQRSGSYRDAAQNVTRAGVKDVVSQQATSSGKRERISRPISECMII